MIAARVNVELSAAVFLTSLLALVYFIMPKKVWNKLVFGVQGRLSSSSLAVFLVVVGISVRLFLWDGWVGLLLPSNTPNLQNPTIVQEPAPFPSPTVIPSNTPSTTSIPTNVTPAPTKSPTFTDKSPIQPVPSTPTFVGKDPQVKFVIGSNTMIYTLSQLEKASSNPLKLGGYYPIQVYAEQGKLFADVTVYGGEGKPPIEIKHNEFLVRPPNWDRNSSQDALEILNETQNVVLQLIYTNPEHTNMEINGVFPFQSGLIIATHNGMVINPTSPQNYKISPIFKYPSWKYPGVLISGGAS